MRVEFGSQTGDAYERRLSQFREGDLHAKTNRNYFLLNKVIYHTVSCYRLSSVCRYQRSNCTGGQSVEPNSTTWTGNRDASSSKFHKNAKPVKGQYIVVLRNDTSEQDVKSLARNVALSFSGK